jgi:hypothetical protein
MKSKPMDSFHFMIKMGKKSSKAEDVHLDDVILDVWEDNQSPVIVGDCE